MIDYNVRRIHTFLKIIFKRGDSLANWLFNRTGSRIYGFA